MTVERCKQAGYDAEWMGTGNPQRHIFNINLIIIKHRALHMTYK